MNRLFSTFRSLKYRNFRLFFPGLVVSQVGIWVQNISISWVVYEMTKSAYTMGLIMFLNTLPLLLLTPFVGVIVDKFDRHKLLTSVQILFAVQALLMTLFAFFEILDIWNIVLFGIFLNSIAALDAPLRQSTFVHLVDTKEDLSNAISLNSSCFNVARLLGPALAGLIISYFGVKYCFLLNFICLIPVIFLVRLMVIPDEKSEHIKNETIIEGLKEGIQYALSVPKIMTLLAFVACFSFIGMTYPMLMPIYVSDVLKSGADSLGFLMSMAGIGALISSFILASKTSTIGLRRILTAGAVIFGLGFILLGCVDKFNIAIFIMLFTGFGMTFALTSDNTLIQYSVDDELRGRILSLNAICFIGTTSLSSYTMGYLAHILGISNTLKMLGIVLILLALVIGYKLSKYDFVVKK